VQQYIVLGYPDRNNFNGSVEMYDGANLNRLIAVNGDGQSLQFGAAIRYLRMLNNNSIDLAILQ
jgi:hypothetical protein